MDTLEPQPTAAVSKSSAVNRTRDTGRPAKCTNRRRHRERCGPSEPSGTCRRRDKGAIDVLVELAGERGDLEELRRFADGGSTDATDVLIELAGVRGDLDELRRLAAKGSRDAQEVLSEPTDELADAK